MNRATFLKLTPPGFTEKHLKNAQQRGYFPGADDDPDGPRARKNRQGGERFTMNRFVGQVPGNVFLRKYEVETIASPEPTEEQKEQIRSNRVFTMREAFAVSVMHGLTESGGLPNGEAAAVAMCLSGLALEDEWRHALRSRNPGESLWGSCVYMRNDDGVVFAYSEAVGTMRELADGLIDLPRIEPNHPITRAIFVDLSLVYAELRQRARAAGLALSD